MKKNVLAIAVVSRQGKNNGGGSYMSYILRDLSLRRFLKIASVGHSTVFAGSSFQCLATLTEK